MKVVVVGRAREVGGFALAGAEVAVCDSDAAANRIVHDLGSSAENVGLVIVTGWAARAAARTIAALRRRRGPPVIAELPNVAEDAP